VNCMANIQGNRVALEDVLDGRIPNHDAYLVQQPLGETRSPFYTQLFGAGDDWRLIEGEGYEVLLLAASPVQQMGGLPAYVRFGQQGPSSPTDTDSTGTIPVLPGTCIPVPQGFRKLWFRPSTDTDWLVVVSKLPLAHINYGPYGYSLPPEGAISWELLVPEGGAEALAVAPVGADDGIAIPSRAKSCVVNISDIGGAPLSVTGPLRIYWYLRNTNGIGQAGLWSRNGGSDDWTTNILGDCGPDHTMERYAVGGFGRIAIYDPTGWTRDLVYPNLARVNCEVIFYG
jgi:hypothetical protein